VTHILGVRAFGTQLLCEQVVGRGLRRISYATETSQINANGDVVEFQAFPVEYAEVYGVPFSFIPTKAVATPPKPGPRPTRVRALEERIACEITFPRVVGYRYELPGERLTANFTPDSQMAISTLDVPTRTETAPIVGESDFHTLYDLSIRREQEVDFVLAKLVLERYFRDAEGHTKPWLFPQLLRIVRRWRAECLTLKDNTFPQLLLLHELADAAAERIYQAIVQSTTDEKTIHPIPRPYDPVGSTRYVDFDTTREVYSTDPELCHVSHIVLDSGWEAKMAQALEEMDEVVCYVKNHGLGFTIPYTLNGQERQYTPDFILRVAQTPQTSEVWETSEVSADLLNLIVEVSGEARKDKAAKVATARNLWIPAINNHGGFGRWAFIEITDPWDAKNTIRARLGLPEASTP
jgi:type III restriction enzyme